MNTSKLFSTEKPLQVFVFFSGHASSIVHMYHMDPQYEYTYVITGAFTDKESAPGIDFFVQHNSCVDSANTQTSTKESISCIVLNWKTFKGRKKGMNRREAYFEKILKMIPWNTVDVVLCAGFRLVIPDSFIQKCPAPIINEHPADLSLLGENGMPLYAGPGLDAIKKTILDKRDSICSTAHFVEQGPVDTGRIICLSDSAVLEKNADPNKVRERMKQICSPYSISRALKMIVQGEITLT